MPTAPLETILYREMSRVSAKEIIDIASPLLQETINYATNALARCATTPSGKIDEDLAVLALYRHIIEMTDGIEVLVAQSCSQAVVPLLRSSFEALLSIEYILETDSQNRYKDFNRRSLAWLLGHIHNRLNLYDRFDFSTNKGATTKKLFDEDKFISQIPISIDVGAARENLKKVLLKDHFLELETEYQTLVATKKREPNWYSLFGGPKNLRALAETLQQGGHYEILYRPWSTTAHAQDFVAFVKIMADGNTGIGRLRNPDELQQMTGYAVSFLLRATRLTIGKFRPDENIKDWYIKEVQKNYQAIFRIPT